MDAQQLENAHIARLLVVVADVVAIMRVAVVAMLTRNSNCN